MYKITVKIDGLMCPMCEKHMNEAFEKAFGVEDVQSSHKSDESIIIAKEIPSDEAIKAAVEKAGYTFKSAAAEPYEKKGIFSKLFKK